MLCVIGEDPAQEHAPREGDDAVLLFVVQRRQGDLEAGERCVWGAILAPTPEVAGHGCSILTSRRSGVPFFSTMTVKGKTLLTQLLMPFFS